MSVNKKTFRSIVSVNILPLSSFGLNKPHGYLKKKPYVDVAFAEIVPLVSKRMQDATCHRQRRKIFLRGKFN
jgi:hypothetical protein